MPAPAPAHPARLAFLGTPALSVPPLRALVTAGLDVRTVITNPDARRGRRAEPTPSPVKQAALDLGIEVRHDVDDLLGADVDLGVVVAFGRIIKPHVLAQVPMVNLHFSLLPRWRGAAPVERAILAGDPTTGVDLMVVEEGLDTGAVYDRTEVPIGPDETVDELRSRLVEIGSEMLVRNLRTGLDEPVPQVGEASYAHKLTNDDLRIDWTASAVEVHRVVRVGGAWTMHEGRRMKVWGTRLDPDGSGILVATGDAPIEVVEVQPEGRARMAARAWANGSGWADGDDFGDR